MRICISCSSEISSTSWLCDKCGWFPQKTNGVELLAPQISGATDSYNPRWYEELARLEVGNFWFVVRNRLIKWLAQRFLGETGQYLEVGCGTGFVLKMLLENFPKWKIIGTEAQLEGIYFARNRVGEDVKFVQMDACSIPFRNEFDAVGAFDVIEHIADDSTAIAQIYAALKPDGYLILSVPQHMFLWSKYDAVGCHFRRYSAKELEKKLGQAGFLIRISLSFNFLLLPLMLVSRLLKREINTADVDVLEELRLPPLLNRFLMIILNFEFLLIRLGLRFPLGGSRVVVAQKACA